MQRQQPERDMLASLEARLVELEHRVVESEERVLGAFGVAVEEFKNNNHASKAVLGYLRELVALLRESGVVMPEPPSDS